MNGAERPRSPLPRAAFGQLLGGLVALALGALLPLGPASAVWLIGAVAALAAAALRLPRWWLPLQLLFAPALYAASALSLAPGWYLAAFLLCLLVLSNSPRDRVPLYLSSAAVWDRLAELLPRGGRFLDLGCGGGGGVLGIARRRPDAACVGVETSPLPWLLGRLRVWRRPRCRVRYASLWSAPLGEFDLVYAFLSPVPMAALWAKARAQMRPGSLLVSNSFAVPGVAPTQVIDLDDRRRSRLYVWRM